MTLEEKYNFLVAVLKSTHKMMKAIDLNIAARTIERALNQVGEKL